VKLAEQFSPRNIGVVSLVSTYLPILNMSNHHLSARDQGLLSAILDSASDYAIIALDSDNKIALWNSGAEKVLGWAAEEAIGCNAEMIFTPEDRARGEVEGEIARALAHGRAEDERWHLRKDGSRFWGSGLLMPLNGKQGFLKIMRDQTKRRETEKALEESELRFRMLAEHIPQLLFRSASLGQRTWGSPQWIAFTGLSEAKSLGLGWMDAVHPAEHDLTLEAWAAAETNGELYVEHRIRRAIDGQYRWFQTRATKLDGEWFGTSTDVDDLKRLKDRQDVLLKELHHRTGNLLAVISSIARRTAQSSSSVKDFSHRFENRVQALSRVQQQIARGNASAIELEDLVKMEMDALGLLETGRVKLQGPSCPLDPKQAETLALAIHELGTNTLKYGALATTSGSLSVSWACSHEGERYFEWLETGVNTIATDKLRRGYGRELIEVALPYALGAQTRLDFHETGTVRCLIALPKLSGEDINARGRAM
jgi:PAS domain S-box-containing protein